MTLGTLVRMAVGASVAASLRTRSQRLGHDLPDCPGATAALGATTQASIDLSGGARNLAPGGHGASDVMVAQDVARTDNHEGKQLSMNPLLDKKLAGAMQKEKAQFEAIPNCQPQPGALEPGFRTSRHTGKRRTNLWMRGKAFDPHPVQQSVIDRGGIPWPRSLNVQAKYETLTHAGPLQAANRFRRKVTS